MPFLLLVLSLKANLSLKATVPSDGGGLGGAGGDRVGWGGEGWACRVGEVLVCFRSLIVSTAIFLSLTLGRSLPISERDAFSLC